MKILIIAKSFNQQSARAIQMRRVVEALLKYTDSSIILITQGNELENQKTQNFQKYNINGIQKSNRFKQRLFSGVSNFDVNFIERSTKLVESIIKKQKIDLLFTVSTPIECHKIGLNIKKNNPELKWITFFSDLWPSHIVPKPLYRKKLGSKTDMKFMTEIAENCDTLITPSEYTLEILKQQIPEIKAKLVTINHVSRDLDQNEFKDQLNGYVIHSGYLQKERIAEDLILAFKELEKNPLFNGLILVGKNHPKLTKLIKKHNCNKIYLFGSVSEELAGKLQSMCEISIIIEAPMDVSPFLPSKITDSILLSNKVITISPKTSALKDISNNWKGVFTSTYSKDEIVTVIETALESKESISLDLKLEMSPQVIAERYYNTFKA